jgi:hypothetical protein
LGWFETLRNEILISSEKLHKNVQSLHTFALSKFDEAIYKATDRANAKHGVFVDVHKDYFFYQTIKIVKVHFREI